MLTKRYNLPQSFQVNEQLNEEVVVRFRVRETKEAYDEGDGGKRIEHLEPILSENSPPIINHKKP